MITIRGAITINNNVPEEIITATTVVLTEIFEKNDVNKEDILYILFTATNDIDKAYPAVAAREMGITEASLMCMQEMHVEGSLGMCIRVMVAANSNKSQKEVTHCYLENAGTLRPDLVRIKRHSVAIDGPTASGKSSVSKEVAKRLSLKHVETGAMYRAVALFTLRKALTDKQDIINALPLLDLSVEYDGDDQKVFLEGEDVTDEIRTEVISSRASFVAAIDEVREKLLPIQRSIAENYNVIMDGRDIQTVVLPNADVKIFITASIFERTKRRCIDLEKKGEANNFETVKRQIEERDTADTSRMCAPLLKAETAVEIDTTEMTFDEAVNKVLEIITEKIGGLN